MYTVFPDGQRYSGIALAVAGVFILSFLGCDSSLKPDQNDIASSKSPSVLQYSDHNEPGQLRERRERMVQRQLRDRGITDERVLEAMRSTVRHRFVPDDLVDSAYDDFPLPIGQSQTISQPYIVALMTELVRPEPHEKALDIGTGSGYQAAVLAKLVDHVYTIEIVQKLADQAQDRLKELGYSNVTCRQGDGYQGWIEEAPFDIIVVAAAPEEIPQPLIDQLAFGGRLVIPVGREAQMLKLIEKKDDGSIQETQVAAVRFVPMTGEASSNE